MSPNGHMYFHHLSPNYSEDFATADPQAQGHFIHEMTHIWQHQAGLLMPLARLPGASYRYHLKPGRPFRAYGLEQQAEMVRHAFMQRFCCLAAPHYAPLEALAALLPFSPWRA